MKIPRFDSRTAEFAAWLADYEKLRRTSNVLATRSAEAVVKAVARHGDRAVVRFARQFDGFHLTPETMRVSADEISAALKALPAAERRALAYAARRIRAFHQRQLERSFEFRDELGVRLGQVVRPLRRVGIYVPGGRGVYPSSVLMNALPARIAGVSEIVMMCPLAEGDPRARAVLAAAAIAGVEEIYRLGGAHAIAALAYGTETIAPVDKIVGPGNSYVQAAKRLVYGIVDIDKIAGPSEVVVIADDRADPEFIAADLLAQAEHGSGDETAILFSPAERIVDAVGRALDQAVRSNGRSSPLMRALSRRGALVKVRDLEEAVALTNRICPEHLELEVRNARRLARKIHSAGAVFVGSYSPAPLGDYMAGPNHVLPTGGTARFASPLGVYDFLKRSTIIEGSRRALRTLAPMVASLARLEGFEAHARAVELRIPERVAKLEGDANRRRSAQRRRSSQKVNAVQ